MHGQLWFCSSLFLPQRTKVRCYKMCRSSGTLCKAEGSFYFIRMDFYSSIQVRTKNVFLMYQACSNFNTFNPIP